MLFNLAEVAAGGSESIRRGGFSERGVSVILRSVT